MRSLAGDGSEEMAGAGLEEVKPASKSGCVRKNIRKVWRWLQGQVRSRVSYADEADEGEKGTPL